jgi:hypothetical protein
VVTPAALQEAPTSEFRVRSYASAIACGITAISGVFLTGISNMALYHDGIQSLKCDGDVCCRWYGETTCISGVKFVGRRSGRACSSHPSSLRSYSAAAYNYEIVWKGLSTHVSTIDNHMLSFNQLWNLNAELPACTSIHRSNARTGFANPAAEGVAPHGCFGDNSRPSSDVLESIARHLHPQKYDCLHQ